MRGWGSWSGRPQDAPEQPPAEPPRRTSPLDPLPVRAVSRLLFARWLVDHERLNERDDREQGGQA